jgi:hypothetical protein
MDRKEQLKKLITVNSDLVENLIDDLVFMESQLDYYKTLPMIRVDASNPERQKATPASKLYKETIQQYTNVIKVLAQCTGQDADNEESPLRKWAKKYVNST